MLNRFLNRWEKDREAFATALINEDAAEIRRHVLGVGTGKVRTVFMVDNPLWEPLELHAVHYAAHFGKLKALQVLHEVGLPLDQKPIQHKNLHSVLDSFSTVHFAAAHNHQEVIEYLASKGVGLDIFYQKFGNAPLHTAIEHKAYQAIETICRLGANINACNENQYSPLLVAVSRGDLNAVDILISHGANTECKTRIGITPLVLAISNRQTDIVRYLLGAGAEINEQECATAFELTNTDTRMLVEAYIEKRRLCGQVASIATQAKRSTVRM